MSRRRRPSMDRGIPSAALSEKKSGTPQASRAQNPIRRASRFSRHLWRMGNQAVGAALQHLRGKAVPAEARAELQPAFQEDFSEVRIHDDSNARSEAMRLGAQAFSDGEDIYLGPEAPDLNSPAGKRLIAHELAHVVQARQTQSEHREDGGTGDASERGAHMAVEQAMGGKGVQIPDSNGGGLQLQRRAQGASRADLIAALTQYLQQAQQAQGGRSVRVTPEVRQTVEMLANAPDPTYQGAGGDPGRGLRLANVQAWLNRPALPGNPADFARQVAQLLPDPFDSSALQRLNNARTAAEAPSRFGRLRNLVESTAPGEPEGSPLPPPEPTSTEKMDQLMRDMRRAQGLPEPSEYGPYSLDLLRAGRILHGLPEAWRGPQSQRQPAPAPLPQAVENAIQSVNSNALIPAGVRQDEAGNYADARFVARQLAHMLDRAQAQGQDSIDLHLGANYNQVRDRQSLFQELARIIGMLRDGFPHHASRVRRVNVYFGDRVVRVIPVSAASE